MKTLKMFRKEGEMLALPFFFRKKRTKNSSFLIEKRKKMWYNFEKDEKENHYVSSHPSYFGKAGRFC